MAKHANLALRTVLAVALAASVGACATKTANRGNLPTDSQLAELQVGKDSRREVASVLGTPSTVSTFDNNVWYYISRKTEKWAFLDADVVEQNVLAMYFNDKGVLQHIERYTLDDSRDVELVDRETATAGHSLGFFEQIFGNLGRFGSGSQTPTGGL